MPSLEERIKERIRQRGPIPFAEFMRLALYDPEGGYYTAERVRIGPEGDFYTAPATHPAFAALIALQLERMWQLLEQPTTLVVVEGGGAKGLLARDLLAYATRLNPAFSRALSYHILEPERLGQARLDKGGTLALTWEQRRELEPLPWGVFLSNELFDALPRHRVIVQAGTLFEVYVGLHRNDFVDVVEEPSTPELGRYFQEVGVELPEGCRGEVDLEGPRLLEQMARSIQHGFALTIDYGYPAEQLYSERRRQGTMRCYHKHTATTNMYIRVGRQDITAHVDFSSLARAGERGGMATEALITQQRYLKKLGIQTFLDRLREASLPQEGYLANRMSLQELTRPEGFGQFGVLVQSKGVGPLGLDAIATSRAREGDPGLPLPMLGVDHMPLFQGRYPHLAQQPDLLMLL